MAAPITVKIWKKWDEKAPLGVAILTWPPGPGFVARLD